MRVDCAYLWPTPYSVNVVLNQPWWDLYNRNQQRLQIRVFFFLEEPVAKHLPAHRWLTLQSEFPVHEFGTGPVQEPGRPRGPGVGMCVGPDTRAGQRQTEAEMDREALDRACVRLSS